MNRGLDIYSGYFYFALIISKNFKLTNIFYQLDNSFDNLMILTNKNIFLK